MKNCIEQRTERPSLCDLYAKWDQLADVVVDEDGATASSFLHFSVGTPREEIWKWFEAQDPRFSVGDLQRGIRHADGFPPIAVGGEYEFFSELQQAEMPEQERMRNYTGQTVTVLAGPLPKDDEEGSDLFKICAADGREFEAFEEELNGWNKALGQYFWPDGTYGPQKDKKYLVNETKLSKPQENPQVRYVIRSLSEGDEELDGSNGAFWSNEDGWGHLQTATHFSTSERMTVHLPTSAKMDAEWMLLEEANDLVTGAAKPAL